MNHVVDEDTQKDDIVIVAHQVVIRCLMVYFKSKGRSCGFKGRKLQTIYH